MVRVAARVPARVPSVPRRALRLRGAGQVNREVPELIRYEIRRALSAVQPYYCRAVSVGNNAVLMTSETYREKSGAVHVAYLMKNMGGQATVVDLT